jgi:hypothetical protein
MHGAISVPLYVFRTLFLINKHRDKFVFLQYNGFVLCMMEFALILNVCVAEFKELKNTVTDQNIGRLK